ncbi:dihydropteroate synthase [Arenibaculum sp.]|uniref:dihydropteroate synthase n=1 Tax=Arenibaculum sp. TaxID=2865862 RepID=UPI002E114975|nr:dihydropteroate synthase [Arenibaculum sp.]
MPEPGEGARLFLRPVAILSGAAARRAVEAGSALPLAGGPLAFAAVEAALRQGPAVEAALRPAQGAAAARAVAAPADVLAWARTRGLEASLDPLVRPRPAFAGLAPGRAAVMGIVNATPDSFSDGGRFLARDAAIAHGAALLEAGADLLDVGGESTRPGAEPVDPDEESRRVVPVIRHFAERGALVSVDTRHAAVMAAAVAAGARIVNDVTALAGDPASLGVVRRAGVPVVLMHMRGEPRTMQQDPVYDDAPLDVFEWLEARLDACLAANIPPADLAVDPGIGFGKTVAHNLDLLASTALFHGLGVPILVGVSRKGFIARLGRGEEPTGRLAGSLAAGLAAVRQGAAILRVHDVAETVQARAVWSAIEAA